MMGQAESVSAHAQSYSPRHDLLYKALVPGYTGLVQLHLEPSIKSPYLVLLYNDIHLLFIVIDKQGKVKFKVCLTH